MILIHFSQIVYLNQLFVYYTQLIVYFSQLIVYNFAGREMEDSSATDDSEEDEEIEDLDVAEGNGGMAGRVRFPGFPNQKTRELNPTLSTTLRATVIKLFQN